jgi:hypothetical protein
MTRHTLETAAFCAALLIAALAFHAWLASRDEQQRLHATLAAQKQVLDAADVRERARDTALNATLAEIDNLKRATQTPAQVLRELPKYLPLPEPITLAQTDKPAPVSPQQGTALPERPEARQASAQIPAADLKPLYDYVQDCRACQAQLAAAKQDRADDAAKISALTLERDAAVTAAKGGSVWRRLRRNALWFAIGAAAGYAAAKR